MDLRNLIENRKRRLIDDYIGVLRNKIHDVSRLIWKDDGVDVFADQHDGNVKPFSYSRIYRLTPLEGLPATPPLSTFLNPILPQRPAQNIIVGREGAFYLNQINFITFSNWSFDFTGSTISGPAGDLFDPAFFMNGGAIPEIDNSISANNPTTRSSPIGFELQLYDRKRGGALHEDKLPFEVFHGNRVANKTITEPIRFDPNSDVEPRVFLTSPQTTETGVFVAPPVDLTVTRRACWLNIMFKGYLALEV